MIKELCRATELQSYRVTELYAIQSYRATELQSSIPYKVIELYAVQSYRATELYRALYRTELQSCICIELYMHTVLHISIQSYIEHHEGKCRYRVEKKGERLDRGEAMATFTTQDIKTKLHGTYSSMGVNCAQIFNL